MDHLHRLRLALERHAVTDSYQYVNGSVAPATLPCDIRLIQRHRHAARLGHAVHDQFTLVIPLEGPGIAVVDGLRLRLEPGCILLIHPGQVHGYEDAVDVEVTWLFCSFHHGDGRRWADLQSQVLPLPERAADDLAALLPDHFLDVGHGKRATPTHARQVALRLELVLERLLAAQHVRRHLLEPSPEADATHAFVQRVVAHVGAHLGERLSIAGIARAMQVSPSHLRNEFQRLSGLSLGRYIRTARIRQACVLLDTTDLGIAEVGRRCGYDSVFSFSRAFRADKGIPPSDYRRDLRPVT